MVRPFISVIMPVYNREAYLGEAVESILNQTHTAFELILADDGSEDASGELVREYARRDKRIRPVFLPHQGLPRTLNTLVPMARGSLIAFPERLDIQLEWMRENQLDLCGTQVESFGTEFELLDTNDRVSQLPEQHEVIVREVLFQVPLWRSTLIFKTSAALRNPFDETMACTDCEWPYRVVQNCVTGNVPQILLRARRHGRNATILNGKAHRRDATKSHFLYFYRLYPQASIQDYIALCRVIDQVPLTSLAELERAGRWMWNLKDHIAIQVGNSADPGNPHFEIFHWLAKYDVKDVKVFAPLSYGDPEYRVTVIARGKELFGDNFFPLTTYSSHTEYNEHLASMDVLICNHQRQQAFGNISISLYLGIKVFLRNTITPWPYLSEKCGCRLFDTQTIPQLSFAELLSMDEANRQLNRKHIEFCLRETGKDQCGANFISNRNQT